MSKSKGRRLAEWLRNLDSNSKASSDTIADDSISTAKLQTDAVTNPKIADGAVHTANLADANVTFAKLHTALVVTESDAIGSNDNDTTIATSAAIKDYVDTQVAGKDALSELSGDSDDITEGSSNLYFTNERVDDRVNSLLTAGTGITLTYDDTANTLTVAGAAQYGDSDVASYLSTNGYGTSSSIIASITDSAPTTLDTLNELAAALGDDANFSTTVTNSIGTKWTQDNTKISNWDTAYGWGNHASAGYLTSFDITTQTDPKYVRSDADDSVSNQITFPSAIGNRPILQGGFLARLSSDGDADIWGISEDYYPSNGTASNAWGIRWASTPNEIQFVGANQNKLRIDLDTNGTVYIDNNEVWHAGNDGSGSGLDADTVDGIQGSNILTLSGSQTITGTKTFSAASGNIFKLNDTNATNATNANIYFYFQANGSNLGYIGYGSASTNYLYINNPSAPIYLAGSSVLLRGGYEAWGADNDGSGSGLDADLLDGQQGSYYTDMANSSGQFTTISATNASSRDKIRVYPSSNYAIGMESGITYGHLNDWAMTFQMNDDSQNDRGFWWGDAGHSTAQGAMSLTINGRATIATSLSIGQGESITGPDSTTLYVGGNLTIASGSLTLPAGYNLQWGAGYSSGKSTIWSDGTANIIRMAPTGNSSGKTLELSATATTSLVDLQADADIQSKSQIRAQGWWNTSTGNYGDTAVEIGMSGGTGYILCYNRNTSSYANLTIQPASLNLAPASNGAVNIKGHTAWHAGNDGSGSGLDADLLDGQDGSYYLNYNNLSNKPTIPTNNNQLTNGAGYITSTGNTTGYSGSVKSKGNYVLSASTLGSSLGDILRVDFVRSNDGWPEYGTVISARGYTSGGGGAIQFYAPYGSGYGGSTLQYRLADYSAGTSNPPWTSWKSVWDSSNDGSGSGLDADLLDGSGWLDYTRDIHANQVIADDWLRTTGNTGWYNNTYAGGWYMTDTTWIRSYNNKSIYQNVGTLRTDGTLQVGGSGGTFNAPNGGTVTISGSTAWHAGNDGSGSGLDADTVDGVDSGSFLRSDADDTSTGLIDFQRGLGIHRQDGVYVTPTSKTKAVYWKFAESSQLNSPPGSGTWRHVATIQGWTQHSSSYPSWQMSFGNGAFGVRQSTSNSAWAGWQTVWTSGNDGSGSGLDADTLDGYQGSNYIGLNGNSYYQLTNWLQSTGSHGFYSPSSGAGTHFYPGDLGNYGSFRVDGRKGSWSGISLEGRVVFMHNGSTASGIYNDVDNHWLFYGVNGDKTAMYHNGSEKIYTYASGGRVTGNLLATSNVYAYYSDERLKDKTGKIENALDKVDAIETFYYTHNDKANELGYEGKDPQVGVSAQSVEAVMPEVVHLAPIDDDGSGVSISGENYKTVQYEKLVPLLIEAIKEQQAQIKELKEIIKCQ